MVLPCVLGDEVCGDRFWWRFLVFLDEFECLFQTEDAFCTVCVVTSGVLETQAMRVP